MSFFQDVRTETANQSKHDQLVHGITHAISNKSIRTGQSLPSISTFMKELSLSRMTVIKALNELKNRGIIESKRRVGYFVKSENVEQQLKVMLLLTAFNPYQEALYNALTSELDGHNISVDLFFHHGNPTVFSYILKDNLEKYGLYLITPLEHHETLDLMNQIPDDKLLQITRPTQKLANHYIIQDFYSEVINALESVKYRFTKYKKFILVYPTTCYHPPQIVKAFRHFCTYNNMKHSVVSKPDINANSKHHAYFIIDDGHLIQAIKDAEHFGFILGNDFGVLSYNDTPMKEMIRQGITVISTDFVRMGRLAGQFIITKKPVNEVIKTNIILRNSL
jgi:DNA-binding transcriptional regulator YhcF (GntR family)